jgi:uracil-DNA glycosylase
MLLNYKWSSFLEDELQKQYFKDLEHKIDILYKSKTIFPKYEHIFRAFNLVEPKKIKVVIIGQDPYHGLNQANGLAFSVSSECKIPPSLRNIFKELVDDIGCDCPKNGVLDIWAGQGVLLINTILSVEEAKPHSHKNIGWEVLTDAIISKLSLDFNKLVFILWGGESQKKEKLVDTSKHLILKSSHPSPLSSYRGFFSSKPFSKTNAYLKSHNKSEINWCLI